MAELPTIVSLKTESDTAASFGGERTIADLNDSVVKLYVWNQPYHWHQHPNSDEAFLVVEGALDIEFDGGTVRLQPGDLLTVPRGTRHRTKPVGNRCVGVAFESGSSTEVT
jgi:mannose-6-phosphate isomerase-like protein (cupin superfamily)